jgi:hypothetical protein
MTKDEFERQTEELARQLQHAIDHWDDPDQVAAREAYEREKEERQAAIFELSYIRTGQKKPSETREHAIKKMTAYFSDEIEASSDGKMRQPLPVLASGEDVTLELHEQHGKSVLELTVSGKRGAAKKVLTTGARGNCIAMLRAPQLPAFIELTTQQLLARVGSR